MPFTSYNYCVGYNAPVTHCWTEYQPETMGCVPILILLLVASELARAQNKESQDFLQKLMEDMDPRIRPTGKDGGPVTVKVNFHVVSFSSISEISMDYKIDILFREYWTDPRLIWTDGPNDHISLSSRASDMIWTPDLYFPNEKDAKFHVVTVPNKLFKIFNNGMVTYSVRLTLTLACPMELASFPMDTQTCAIKVESYAYETHDIKLEWQDPPVEFDDELELPQFELGEIRNLTCQKQYKTTGSFPCLKATFTLDRHFGFFLLQTYIPSVLIIILSWVSFWINMDAVPARITLGVTTVMTMATQLSGSKSSIPKVSYPKAIDVWMSMGMVFVFAALLEYAFVNAMSRKNTKAEERHKKTDCDAEDEKMEMSERLNGSSESDVPHGFVRNRKHINYRNFAHNIDKISRIAFPAIFVIFNLVYWPVYASHRFYH